MGKLKELEKEVSRFYKEETDFENERRHTTNALFNYLGLSRYGPDYNSVMGIRHRWKKDACKYYVLWCEQGKLTGDIYSDWKLFLKMLNEIGIFYTISKKTMTSIGYTYGFYQPNTVPDKLEWDEKSFRRPIRMLENRIDEAKMVRPNVPLSSGRSVYDLEKKLNGIKPLVIEKKRVKKIILAKIR